MILLTALMVGLLGYQVTMPAVDNAKYTLSVYDGKIIKMNTQNGTFEKCEVIHQLSTNGQYSEIIECKKYQ